MTVAAIVTAAGAGRRMGQDKALLDLGGQSAVARVAGQCLDAGVGEVLVVRAEGALPLPPLPAGVRTVAVSGKGEMADSIRAALLGLSSAVERVVVFPVDHALVAADTVLALHAALGDKGIALPLFRERPGHPVAFRRKVIEELRGAATLRDVVHRDPARVRVLATANPWVCCDLDRPEDLRAARAALAAEPWPVVEQMHRHRSRRAYRPDPLQPGQLERLVDAARCASTSSYIQAYAVVAVADPVRKAEVAALCADQEHIRQAPVFLAICADLSKLHAACERHGAQLQSQSLELFLQATVDAALVGQNLQLAAESEGLGACMIGAARNHPLELAHLLALPPHAFVLFGMAVGWPADDPIGRGRMPLTGVLHRESYDTAASEAALAGADAVIRSWAVRTNAERGGYQGRPVDERKGWAERMAQLWGEHSRYVKARASLRAELARLGFGLE
jgi:nitroreductase